MCCLALLSSASCGGGSWCQAAGWASAAGVAVPAGRQRPCCGSTGRQGAGGERWEAGGTPSDIPLLITPQIQRLLSQRRSGWKGSVQGSWVPLGMLSNFSTFSLFFHSACRTSLFTVAHSEGFTLPPSLSVLNYLEGLWQCSAVPPSLERGPGPVAAAAGTGRDLGSCPSARVQREPATQAGVRLPVGSWSGGAERVPGKRRSDV